MPRSIQIAGCASQLRTYNRERDLLNEKSLLMLWDEQARKYLLFIGVGFAILKPESSKYYLLSKMTVDNVDVFAWLRANLDSAADLHDAFEELWQPRSGEFNFTVPDFFPDRILIRYRSTDEYETDDEHIADEFSDDDTVSLHSTTINRALRG